MNSNSWPRLATWERRVLTNRAEQMEKVTRRIEQFILLPLLSFLFVALIALFFTPHPYIEALLFLNRWAFIGYGFMKFPGRAIALFLKRLDLKKHQMMRHMRWKTKRSVREVFKRFLKYRKFSDPSGEYPEGVYIRNVPRR